MEDMSGCVIGLHLLTAHPIYRGGHPVAGLNGTTFLSGTYNLVVASRNDVEDLKLAILRKDPTLIRYLSTTCGVERILRQNQVQLTIGLRHPFGRNNHGLDLLPLVPDEAALEVPIPERRHEPFVALHST